MIMQLKAHLDLVDERHLHEKEQLIIRCEAAEVDCEKQRLANEVTKQSLHSKISTLTARLRELEQEKDTAIKQDIARLYKTVEDL